MTTSSVMAVVLAVAAVSIVSAAVYHAMTERRE